jgi:uncharacterized protein (DUF433 family)
MRLEDYFDFLAGNDIRIKGTRVGIETVLYDWIHKQRPPDEIADAYPSISREQVYATITYYLHNQDAVDRYLDDWIAFCDRSLAADRAAPNRWPERVREAKRRWLAAQAALANTSG